MENNNSYEKFLASTRKRLPENQFLVECNVAIESEEDVEKVLGVEATAVVDQVEALSGEASVTGTITVSLMFLTLSQQIGCATYSTGYTSRIADAEISPESKLLVCAKMEDASVSSLSKDNAKLLCNVALQGENFKNEEITYISEAGEDIYTKQVETTAMFVSNSLTSTWTESQQCSIKEPVRSLLCVSNDVVCKSLESAYNIITVEGQVYSKLVYVTDEETPVLKTVYNTFDFRQDIEAENISKEAMAEVMLTVIDSQAKATIDEKNGQVTVEVEIPIRANLMVFENKTVLTAADLFSTKNNVLVTNSGYNNCVVKNPEFFEKKIEGSVNLTENEPRIDKLLAVTFSRAKLISSYVKDEQITIEGIALANLIYLNDEEGKVFSVDVEIPFVVANSTDIKEDAEIDAFIKLCDVDVMVKKGRDIYLDAILKVFVNVTECTSGAVISGLEVGEPLPKQDIGLEIYFAKAGDDVWDIAREVKVRPETIERQNEEFVFPLEADEKISIYYSDLR